MILAPHLQGDQEGRPRPAARRVRRPSGSGATACAGRGGRALQRRPGVQAHLPRRAAGVIVTLIADNYFGYCKKEVKTQISYAANLFGNVEEEHAGGALVFASFNLGESFQANSRALQRPDVRRRGARLRPRGSTSTPEGYGIDRQFPDLIYVPENALARPAPADRVVDARRRRRTASRCCPARST